MTELLPLAILMTSLGIAPVILAMPDHWRGLRTAVNLGAATVKVVLVAWLSIAVAGGAEFGVSVEIAPGLALALQADALVVLFLALSAVLWFLTTLYAVGYLEERHRPKPVLRLLQPLRRLDGRHRDGREPLHVPRLL